MDHLQQFKSRKVIPLPTANQNKWLLKRYAILAGGRNIDNGIVSAALKAAYVRLPDAGRIEDGAGNNGVGFQIVHFAEVAMVSPIFYWQWGSVLANTQQMRAQWESPTEFENGVGEVCGCIWEMEIVNFEVNLWKHTLLNNIGTPAQRVAAYLEQSYTNEQ